MVHAEQSTTRWHAIRDWVTKETSGGALLLGAAILALIWANSPFSDAYHALSEFHVGWSAIGTNLSLAHWAADGLLAIFFFLVGVELKHDLVVGALRNLKEAAVPVIAAVGGMAMPAVIYFTVINVSKDSTALHGWAIPTATDIAFALAVLAVFGRGLPRALRMFLMTLAVIDDLLAIIIIAVFYTSELNLPMALGTLVCVGMYLVVVRSKRWPWPVLFLIGAVGWWFMLVSGIHATIAGVLMGFCVPARPVHGEEEARTTQLHHALTPVSSGIVLPIFSFFAAGVTFLEHSGDETHILLQPVVLAIMLGLVLGKVLGVLATTAIVTKVTPLRLPDAVGLRDLFPIGLLCGMGFTVSLLISELSFPDGTHTAGAKIGVLMGTLISAILGAIALALASESARSADMNLDGIPDVHVEPITGKELWELEPEEIFIDHMDDASVPPLELDDLARLDGLELDVENEWKRSVREHRPGHYAPHPPHDEPSA